MIDAPLALAFAAGLVATVNPCGFAMLPAYLSYFMGIDDEDQGRPAALRGALVVGAIVSAGFLVVFGLAGILITAGFRVVIDVIPWVAIVVGVAVIGLGIALLRGYELQVGLPKAGKAASGKGYRSVFLFGISYAVASLSCTLPVFLTVVATQVTRGSFVSGIATFVAYGAGMAVVLMAVTIAIAVGKQTLIARLRGSARYITRVSGAILVAAGVYIVWFWTVSLRSGAQALGDNVSFQFIEHLSQTVQNAIASAPLLWGFGFVAIVVVAVIVVVLAQRTRQPSGEHAMMSLDD
ncbi:MAG: cytochrome c biogenesis CcdA family protein [Actinomycetota bacterium]|nr:cytochrome c biogenesis CcdA family protein [Actinomycetota bacterium]